MSMLRQKKLGPHRSDLFTEIFYTKSILSDDITVADIVVWELSLSFASGLEHCSGRYKVTDGNHLTAVMHEFVSNSRHLRPS
ncbi:hypothetical protein WJX79_006234 [Trebouxia sp. C0005]